jgi:carbon storage regulator
MLVLSRKKDESILINDSIVVTIVDIRGDKVKIGIDAPRDVAVHRQEVLESILREKVKLQESGTEESCEGSPALN